MSKSGNYNLGEIEKRDALIRDMASVLHEAREHIDGEIDVIDGSDGVPSPNKAMSLATAIDEVLSRVAP